VPGEPLQRPRQPGGGGLVPGQQQRDELIPQLVHAHRQAFFVPRPHQHGQHVLALAERRVLLAAGDLVAQRRVRALLDGPVLPPRPGALQPGVGVLQQVERGQIHQWRQDLAQVGQPMRVVRADDRAQDHLEGDVLHPRPRREPPPGRPPRHLRGGDVCHHRGQCGHRLAVEGGHHQPPLAPVLGAVGDQHRPGAEHALEGQAVGLAGPEDVGVAAQHPADVGRIGQVHEVPQPGQPQREAATVTTLAPAQERLRAGEDDQALDQAGQRWPGGQRGARKQGAPHDIIIRTYKLPV
jgi:hypothetical protein